MILYSSNKKRSSNSYR